MPQEVVSGDLQAVLDLVKDICQEGSHIYIPPSHGAVDSGPGWNGTSHWSVGGPTLRQVPKHAWGVILKSCEPVAFFHGKESTQVV